MGLTSSDTVRVALVGAGNMAREHARVFSSLEGACLTGIYSRTRGRAEELAAHYRIPEVCDSVESLYERTQADLVVVTVIERSMAEVSRACFAFPWTVLLEKPAGYHLADAKGIHAAATAAGRRVFVALNRRHYSATRAALADLAGRDEPRFIQVFDQEDQAGALASGQPADVVRNWMYANSLHLVDYFRVFGRGSVSEIQRPVPWVPERPGHVVSVITFDSGDTGVYVGQWDGPGPWAVTVTVPSQRWELRPLERAAYQPRGERRLHPVDPSPSDEGFKAGFHEQGRLAIAAARGEATSLPTLSDALESMRLVQAVFGIDH
jgi:predicted dehydrogenase